MKSDYQTHWDWCREQEAPYLENKIYKDMLIDWIEWAVDQAGEIAISKVNPTNWPSRRIEVRRQLHKSLGLDPLPTRSPCTQAKLIGKVERDGYTIERIVLEPREHFLMPVHLYLPENGNYPAPTILYAPGHWMINSKTEPDIQAFCIGMAKLGFVVLVFDPIGQGERGASFADHSRRDLLLSGLSQEGIMAWESMRAIDYLLTRSEVDGNRIGMTGASGGGLNTLYTCAADERIAVAASVCYVTSFSRFFRAMRNLNWNNQNDLCNQVPNVIRDAEMAGLCGLIHPRPLLVINGWQDPQFPVEGAQEVIDQISEIYSQVDPKRLRLTAIDSDHGYNQEMREAAYGWFSYWLKGEGEGSPISEPPMSTEMPDSLDLKCILGAEFISSGPALRMLSRTAAASTILKRTHSVAAFSDCLGVSTSDHNIESHSKESLSIIIDNIKIERRVLIPERGIFIPSFELSSSNKSPKGILIYACDEGKLARLSETRLDIVLDNGWKVIMIDPRGIGETAPLPSKPLTLATLDGKIDEFLPPPGFTLEYEAATDSLMLGRSLLGQQTSDLLYTIRYSNRMNSDIPIVLFGSGPRMALAALFATYIDTSVSACWSDRMLPTFNLLVEEDEQEFPITGYVFGILRVADIPDLVKKIVPRKLIISRPIDARLQPLSIDLGKSFLNTDESDYDIHECLTPEIFHFLKSL